MKKIVNWFKNMWLEEAGLIGIKELAMTIAAIVLIGVVVTYLSGGTLNTWVNSVWTEIFSRIQGIV